MGAAVTGLVVVVGMIVTQLPNEMVGIGSGGNVRPGSVISPGSSVGSVQESVVEMIGRDMFMDVVTVLLARYGLDGSAGGFFPLPATGLIGGVGGVGGSTIPTLSTGVKSDPKMTVLMTTPSPGGAGAAWAAGTVG